LTLNEPRVAAGEKRGVLGDVFDVRRSRSVLIHDTWVGYTDHSPTASVYELRRGARGGLAGQGRLSTSIVGERLVDVAIGLAATQTFLNTVARAPIVSGPYEPMQDHTDDYPHIELAFHVDVRGILDGSGIAVLFTESQGKFHSPWGACIGGQLYTLPSNHVGRALAAIRAPLKRGILDRMMT
jgi:hypothetical protein